MAQALGQVCITPLGNNNRNIVKLNGFPYVHIFNIGSKLVMATVQVTTTT